MEELKKEIDEQFLENSKETENKVEGMNYTEFLKKKVQKAAQEAMGKQLEEKLKEMAKVQRQEEINKKKNEALEIVDKYFDKDQGKTKLVEEKA